MNIIAGLPSYYRNEEWRTIIEAENYLISSFGRVKNAKTGRVRTPQYDKDGYHRVVIRGNQGKLITRFIHRLVGEAFIYNANPEKDTYINHKDEVKTNNHVSNLEWCDPTYNANYGTAIERARATRVATYAKTGKGTTSCEVYLYNNDGELIKTFDSITKCGKEVGLHQSTLSHFFIKYPNELKELKNNQGYLSRVKIA